MDMDNATIYTLSAAIIAIIAAIGACLRASRCEEIPTCCGKIKRKVIETEEERQRTRSRSQSNASELPEESEH